MNVTQTRVLHCTRSVLPIMIENRGGRIISITSIDGRFGHPGRAIYSGAKAGIERFSQAVSAEVGQYGITVNNVAPGFVLSNEATKKQWDAYGFDGQEQLIQGIALKRLGTPADIAHAVLFFASDYAKWITGVVLPVDWGK